MRHSSALRSHRNFRRSWAGSQTWTEHPGWTRLYLTVAREHWVHHSKIDRRMAEMGLIHVIPAIPACPVCPESGALPQRHDLALVILDAVAERAW